jgi:hypothetical protein
MKKRSEKCLLQEMDRSSERRKPELWSLYAGRKRSREGIERKLSEGRESSRKARKDIEPQECEIARAEHNHDLKLEHCQSSGIY